MPEGFIYAFTGVLFGLLATAVAVVATGLMGASVTATLGALGLLVPLCVAALILATATVVAPALAARRRPVMEMLRQPI